MSSTSPPPPPPSSRPTPPSSFLPPSLPSSPAPPLASNASPAAERGRRHDLLTAAAALLLFALAAGVGAYWQRDSYALRSPWPPLEAWWRPHAGPGTPAAVAVAALVVAYGPRLAARLGLRSLIAASWAAAMAWTWSLALVDGWERGVTGRLTATGEYLGGVGRFEQDGVGATLRGFTDHILLHSPDHWGTHIAGHPAGAVLTFVGLDEIGLGGGAWGAALCVTAGSSVAAAAIIALRLLTGEERARAAAPFLVLAPGAVWTGVSADGWFAGVAAWSLALLAVAATRGREPGLARRVGSPSASSSSRRFDPWAAAAGLGSGLLLGAAAYLSYGLVLLVVPVAAILFCARDPRPLPYVALGVLAVVAAFTLAGFDWWEGYRLLRTRYVEGYGGVRPYSYWFWGDLATVVASAGVASAAGLRRLAARPGGAGGAGGDRAALAAAVVPWTMAAAMLAADLSGMSKAETERIWLPFTLWLPAAAAALPPRDHRTWLAAQATTALLVNHLFLTGW